MSRGPNEQETERRPPRRCDGQSTRRYYYRQVRDRASARESDGQRPSSTIAVEPRMTLDALRGKLARPARRRRAIAENLCADGRCVHEPCCDAGRQADDHHRGPGTRRHAPPAPGCVHRARPTPMRVLHLELDHVRRCHDQRSKSRCAKRGHSGSAARLYVSGPILRRIRERMSGNLCRCACCPNVVDALVDAAARS